MTLNKKQQEIYYGFMNFFDECNSYPSEGHMLDLGTTSTYQMGITLINYDELANELHVYLRRPGLLIGKGGKTIDALKVYLGCEIRIHEVRNLWDPYFGENAKIIH